MKIKILLFILLIFFNSTSLYAQFYPFKNPYYDLTFGDDKHLKSQNDYLKKWFDYTGYFRMRGNFIYNFDLNRGTLTSTGEPIYPYSPVKPEQDELLSSANMRLRMHPVLNLGKEIKIHSVVDIFDNLVLGGTPEGFPVSYSNIEVIGSTNQSSPLAGKNSLSDSIVIKKLWSEIFLPFGIFVGGRMGVDWGLGLVANSGDGFDDDFDEAVDRIGISTSLFNHFIGISYDFSATGLYYADFPVHGGEPLDLTDFDDVNTVSLAVLKYHTDPVVGMYLNKENVVFNYGAYFSFRQQDYDIPYYYIKGISASKEKFDVDDYVNRDAWALATDFWFRMNMKKFRLESEFAYIHGKIGNASMLPVIKSMPEISMDQYGGVVQAELMPFQGNVSFLIESGLASGDDAYGFGAFPTIKNISTALGDIEGPQFNLKDDLSINNFRFHPNYHIDEILWRRIVGTFTDGFYLKTAIKWYITDGFIFNPEFIYSRCLKANSAPGLANPLGMEFDLRLTYLTKDFFRMGFIYGLFYPLEGLKNIVHELDPEPAHIVRMFMLISF